MDNWKYVIAHIFVTLAGVSSMMHNTWTMGYYFNGQQPSVENISSFIDFIHFMGWILPAFFAAFTIDVGLIVTSYEIKKDGLSFWRGLTFVSLALAAYYLQWLYLGNHMPELALSDSIVGSNRDYALLLNGAAMWILPAVLPVSIILSTFSGDNQEKPRRKQHESKQVQKFEDMPLMPIEENQHIAICDVCGWQSEPKESSGKAAQSLAGHKRNCEVQS